MTGLSPVLKEKRHRAGEPADSSPEGRLCVRRCPPAMGRGSVWFPEQVAMTSCDGSSNKTWETLPVPSTRRMATCLQAGCFNSE